MHIYTIGETGKLIDNLLDHGYTQVQLNEGCLGYGDAVFLAPDENHYNFIIKEVSLNEWSSGQTIRKCAKLSKSLQDKIDYALYKEARRERYRV